MAANNNERPATSGDPEVPPPAPRFRDERTFGIGELSPEIRIRDKNNNVVNLIWTLNLDNEHIILNMDVIQIGYTFIDQAGIQYNIKRVDSNAHTITVSLPGSSTSDSPPAEAAAEAAAAAAAASPAEAAAASKGGMKKRRAHKRHTKKRHTKKRRTHKYRARK